MTTNYYEETYATVKKAKRYTADLERVINVLSQTYKPMTCKEIGLAVFGETYKGSHYLSSHTAQMLRHLRKGGFVRSQEIKGEPFEIETQEWVIDLDKNGYTRYIRVHDDEGNTYEMLNPKYDLYGYKGGFKTVKKTVVPTTTVYVLVR